MSAKADTLSRIGPATPATDEPVPKRGWQAGPETSTVTGDMTTPSLSPHAPFGGRFEVEREVGRGGVGVVYRAFDRERREWVALKLIGVQGVDASEEALFLSAVRVQAGARVPGLPAFPRPDPDGVADEEARADRAERGGEQQDPADRIWITQLAC